MKQFSTRSYDHPKIEKPVTYHSPTIPMARSLYYLSALRAIDTCRATTSIWDTTIAYAIHRGHPLYKENQVEI